MLKEIVSEME